MNVSATMLIRLIENFFIFLVFRVVENQTRNMRRQALKKV